MNNAQPSADLQTAFTNAAELSSVDPVKADVQATALLERHSDLASARHIKAAALRLQGKPGEGLDAIEPLALRHAGNANILHEYALCPGASGSGDKAIEVLSEVLRLDPRHAAARRALGDQLSAAGDDSGSRAAYDKHLAVSTRHPELVEAAEHLHRKQLAKAERLTREVLKKDPVDVVAIRLLAAIGLELGQVDDAINLLERYPID